MIINQSECFFDNGDLVVLGVRFEIPYVNSGKEVRGIEQQWVSQLIDSRIAAPHSVVYDEFGKPGISPGSTRLSISHTGGFVAIALAQTFNPGIDVERTREKIRNIAARVFNQEELANARSHADELRALQILWGAKEALYKSYGKKGLDFIEHIRVDSFSDVDEHLAATVKTDQFSARYTLSVVTPEINYYLVFVTGCEEEPLNEPV